MGNIVKRFKEIDNASKPDVLAKLAHITWVQYTPKDTGNARRKTRLNNNEIHANYAYATRLDQGWSKQFQGQGMSAPTLKALQKYVQNNMKKGV
jgi:hypothetical protein